MGDCVILCVSLHLISITATRKCRITWIFCFSRAVPSSFLYSGEYWLKFQPKSATATKSNKWAINQIMPSNQNTATHGEVVVANRSRALQCQYQGYDRPQTPACLQAVLEILDPSCVHCEWPHPADLLFSLCSLWNSIHIKACLGYHTNSSSCLSSSPPPMTYVAFPCVKMLLFDPPITAFMYRKHAKCATC